MQYLWATGSAFLIAISLNYLLSRRYVFLGSERSTSQAYGMFVAVALVGMILVVGGMYGLVHWVGLHYLLARILTAVLSGFWNYLMNLYVNFQVVGIHT
jgi:putative flippase GtrA